jgi:hypothetical protein
LSSCVIWALFPFAHNGVGRWRIDDRLHGWYDRWIFLGTRNVVEIVLVTVLKDTTRLSNDVRRWVGRRRRYFIVYCLYVRISGIMSIKYCVGEVLGEKTLI